MKSRRIERSVIVVLLAGALVGAVAGCALSAAGPQDDSRTAAVGRIVDLDVNHGYAIVEFPNTRMFVNLPKRDLDKYRVGDELRIDSFGRPLPPPGIAPRFRG